ncbi:MAG: DUF4397 domain-containing protein [Polyangiaceae bacterium]
MFKSVSILSVLALCGATAACSLSTSDGKDDASGPASGGPGAIGGGGPSASGTNPANASGATANLRVVHASPDAPKVDVYAKGIAEPLLRDVAFGDTSAYLKVPTGPVTIELRAAPSKATDPVAYATGQLTIEKDATITAIAAGLLASKDSKSAFRVLPMIEKFRAPAKGSAIVRVVHASADAPTVGIDVGNDDPTAPEVAALSRFDDTGEGGVALPAGAPLALGITAGGARVTSFTAPALPDGAEIFVIATGLVGKLPRLGDGFSLLAIGPKGTIGFIKQDPTVYALHASPDAPAIDGFVGTAKLVDDLAFGKLSSPIQVAPGSYDLDIFGHTDGHARPTGSAVATKKLGALAAGERYLAVASGFLAPNAGEQGFRLSTYKDEFAVDNTTGAELRAVHASPDAPNVDIGLVSGLSVTPVFKDIAFGNASNEGAVPAAGPLSLGVTPTGQSGVIAARFSVTPSAGGRGFAVAAGTLSPHRSTNTFRLLVVDTAAQPWSVTAVHPTH